MDVAEGSSRLHESGGLDEHTRCNDVGEGWRTGRGDEVGGGCAMRSDRIGGAHTGCDGGVGCDGTAKLKL